MLNSSKKPDSSSCFAIGCSGETGNQKKQINMKKSTIILLFALFLSDTTYGQYRGERPSWASDAFFRDLGGSTLEAVKVFAPSREEAWEKAQETLATRRRLASGARIIMGDGEGAPPGVTVWAMCHGTHIDGVEAWFLMQTLKHPNNQFKRIEYTDEYPFSARVFVPGMAQLHKGSRGKGAMFIIAQAATVGGIVTAEVMRSSAEANINASRNPSDRQYYIDQESTLQNVRNICIAGAAVVYVWNIIDGIVARGGRPGIIVKEPLRQDQRRYSFTPYITPQMGNNMASGVSLTIKF